MKSLYNNKGITMPIVLIALVLSLIFGTALLFIVNNQSKFNTIDKQMKTALEYAEAGYNKYLWHLNDDVNFYSVDPNSDAFKDINKEEQVIAKKLLKSEVIEFQGGYYQVEAKKPSDSDRFVNIKSTGWTKENPNIKRTIETKLRKKQFVHHVYVSNDEKNVWWSTGDESLGPLHTNKDINIEKTPIFYDTVSYAGKLNIKSESTPTYKVKNPSQPEKTNTLDFPDTNGDLKLWAEKDNMVFKGRTCIYLDGKNIKIRNGNSNVVQNISIASIKNKVIYVDKETGGGTGKWDIKSGNIFISGKLEGVLTIGAENSIFITHDDPTEWYEYDESKLNDKNYSVPIPPKTPPTKGGIEYSKTTFTMSADKMTRTATGKDMLGLVANNEIYILHYGWPKQADSYGDHWNFEWIWINTVNKSEWLTKNRIYTNIWIDGVYYTEFKAPETNRYNTSIPGRWGTSSKKYDVAPKDITIHAAIFSVNKGFGFEDYSSGTGKNEITLWGNITQNTRLAVKQGNTGYYKKYAHDPRMLYDYPPHILEPTNVGWEIHEWKETNNHLIEKP